MVKVYSLIFVLQHHPELGSWSEKMPNLKFKDPNFPWSNIDHMLREDPGQEQCWIQVQHARNMQNEPSRT